MSRRIAALALAFCCLTLAGAPAGRASAAFLPPLFGAHQPPPGLVFAYHGWRVDASGAARAQKPAKTVRAIKTQIDLVEHLGLSPRIIAFMRAAPIRVEAGAAEPGAIDSPGRYVRGQGVMVRVEALGDKRPVLLRQLLYAYQDQVLAGGFANADVARFRLAAVNKHVWPKTATMLRDDPDYFALTASAYLYGAITREPYTRANLRKTQPDAYQWLANLFDDGKGRI
jgi:hypothetical protein